MKLLKSLIVTLIAAAVVIGAIVGVYKLFPLKYVNEIRTASDEAGVDRYLVAALIKAESNFEYDAVSAADAKGLMQLTDETAAFCAKKIHLEMEEGDIYVPYTNITLGVYYLKRTLDMFSGNEELAIAAYNAGEGRVKEWLGDPSVSTDGENLDFIPYEETKRHVEKIRVYKKVYEVLYPNL